MWVIIQFVLSLFISQILNLSLLQDNSTNTIPLNPYDDSAENDESFYPTEMEKNQISQLRQIMGEELQLDFEKCDDFLIRWLQECEMDLSCASEKLRCSLNWRRSILADIMEENNTYISFKEDPTRSLKGLAKNGGPILFLTMEGWDIRKIILSGRRENLMKHHIQLTERYFQASIKRNRDGEIRLIPGIIVGNIQGFSFKSNACAGCMGFFRDATNVANQHYPRASKFIIFFNAPIWSKPFFQAISSFLSPYFKNTLKIFGREKEEWSPFLLKYVSNDDFLNKFSQAVEKGI